MCPKKPERRPNPKSLQIVLWLATHIWHSWAFKNRVATARNFETLLRRDSWTNHEVSQGHIAQKSRRTRSQGTFIPVLVVSNESDAVWKYRTNAPASADVSFDWTPLVEKCTYISWFKFPLWNGWPPGPFLTPISRVMCRKSLLRAQPFWFACTNLKGLTFCQFGGHFVGSLPENLATLLLSNKIDDLRIKSLSYSNLKMQFENLAGFQSFCKESLCWF